VLEWQCNLKATLVFADNGEPVPAQKGEAPLAGETDGKQPVHGECHFRLRVAALSYRHGRRPFSIRVDADALPGGALGCFACSPAIRGVARLPNEAKPPVPSVEKPHALSHAETAPSKPNLPSPAQSTTAVAPPLPPGCPRPPPTPTVHATARSTAPDATTGDATTDDVLMMDDDGTLSEEEEEDNDEEDAGAYDVGVAVAAGGRPGSHHIYTSGLSLVDELRVQGDMLQRVIAQQRFILGEMSRINAHKSAAPAAVCA